MASPDKNIVSVIRESLAIDLREGLSVEELRKKIADYINPLIANNFNKLISILYRLDINESKLKQLLTDNPAVGDSLNRAIEAGSAQLVKKYRGEVGLFIEAQLATWTKEEMSNRIELSIGRDLQFIRINGTLVGGLVGVVIHFIVTMF